MTAEIVDRVLRSPRYHDVDRLVVERLVSEELPRARSADDAVKRVKRRLHQAVGAFRGAARSDTLAGVRDAWDGDLASPTFRSAVEGVLATHASTRERREDLPALYGPIWELTGRPSRLLDIGCGLNPLTLPWMSLDPGATYHATDADGRPLETVARFLELVHQPSVVEVLDAVTKCPTEAADVALILKLVTTLDRQDPWAATRLLDRLVVRHAVISFARRSLGGRARGMESTYRQRMDRLAASVPRIRDVAERSVPSELVFVVSLDAPRA